MDSCFLSSLSWSVTVIRLLIKTGTGLNVVSLPIRAPVLIRMAHKRILNLKDRPSFNLHSLLRLFFLARNL